MPDPRKVRADANANLLQGPLTINFLRHGVQKLRHLDDSSVGAPGQVDGLFESAPFVAADQLDAEGELGWIGKCRGRVAGSATLLVSVLPLDIYLDPLRDVIALCRQSLCGRVV